MRTPLHLACKHGCLEAVRAFLDKAKKGQICLHPKDSKEMTPLDFTCKKNQPEIGKMFLIHWKENGENGGYNIFNIDLWDESGTWCSPFDYDIVLVIILMVILYEQLVPISEIKDMIIHKLSA